MTISRVFVLSLLLSGCAPDESIDSGNDRCTHLSNLAIEAALGSADSQYNLAVEFWRGECVEPNLVSAAYLWEQAAEQGVLQAHNNLAYLLYYGKGVAQDQARAVDLWQTAANSGELESKIHLGHAYLPNEYIGTSPVEAFAWAESARICALTAQSNAHQEMANEVLVVAESLLSSQELIEARALAAQRSACVFQ